MRRGLSKIKKDYSRQDFYKDYKKQPYAVGMMPSRYGEITKDVGMAIMSEIIYNNYKYTIPDLFGTLMVVKYKKKLHNEDGSLNKKKLSIDFNRTLEYWKQIYPDKTEAEIKAIPNKKKFYHINEHTDGYKVWITWNRKIHGIKHFNCYKIRVSRRYQRELARYVKNIKCAPFFEMK